MKKITVLDMFRTLLNHADMLCTTPALACKDTFEH